MNDEPVLPEGDPQAAPLADEGKMANLAEFYPAFAQMASEIERERESYKKNEHAYRRYMEKSIVEAMAQALPRNLRLDISVLFKAKSFLSGDFSYASRFANNTNDIYLLWVGDSISHGTGSKIVKDILNEIIQQVYNYSRARQEYSLDAFVKRVQHEFSSPRVVKKILGEDLSDIIPGNDDSSKMAIVIPIVFLQIERIANQTWVRICNRGMPGIVHLRPTRDGSGIEKVYFYTKKDVHEYHGRHAEKVELMDHSGLPLVLDREIYNTYVRNSLKKRGVKVSDAAIQKELFTVVGFRIQPGDLLCIPSDGVMESVNKERQEYGLTRFLDEIIDSVCEPGAFGKSLNDFKESYYTTKLRTYTVWNEQYPISGNGIEDDMTVVLLRYR